MRDDQVDKRPSSQRIYTYRKVVELLHLAGLDRTFVFGSLDKLPFPAGARKDFCLFVRSKKE